MHRVTRRKLQTPGIAEEHKRQETPTINPIGPTDTPHRQSTKHYRKDSRGYFLCRHTLSAAAFTQATVSDRPFYSH